MLADTGEHLHAILQGLHGRVELGAFGKVRESLSLPIQDTVGLRTPPEIVVVNDSNPEILVGSPREPVEQGVMVSTKEQAIANIPSIPHITHGDYVGCLESDRASAHAIADFAE